MTAPFPLTPAMRSRKLQLLGWVKGYIAENGQLPTMSELSAGVGVCETRVKELVRTLVSEGRLKRGPGKQRRLQLPDKRDEAIRKLRQDGSVYVEQGTKILRATFGGQPSARVSRRDRASDPVPIAVAAGTWVYGRMEVSVDHLGQGWPLSDDAPVAAAGDGAYAGLIVATPTAVNRRLPRSLPTLA